MIRDHIAANLGIEPEDFEYAPFAQEGGLGRVVLSPHLKHHQLIRLHFVRDEVIAA